MEVRWLGKSCFKLTESTGTVVLCDPYEGLKEIFPDIKPDIVTSSCAGEERRAISQFKGDFIHLYSNDYLEHKGVTVVGLNSFADDKGGVLRGTNLIFKYRMDGLDVCFMGKLGHNCDIEIVSDLLPVDILILPVGGSEVLDADEAKEYVDALMPDVVFPCDFKTKTEFADFDKVDVFLKLFDEEDIIEPEQDVYHIDRDDIDHETTKIVVLKRN